MALDTSWGGGNGPESGEVMYVDQVPDKDFCLTITCIKARGHCGKTPAQCKREVKKAGFSLISGNLAVCECGAKYLGPDQPSPHARTCNSHGPSRGGGPETQCPD